LPVKLNYLSLLEPFPLLAEFVGSITSDSSPDEWKGKRVSFSNLSEPNPSFYENPSPLQSLTHGPRIVLIARAWWSSQHPTKRALRLFFGWGLGGAAFCWKSIGREQFIGPGRPTLFPSTTPSQSHAPHDQCSRVSRRARTVVYLILAEVVTRFNHDFKMILPLVSPSSFCSSFLFIFQVSTLRKPLGILDRDAQPSSSPCGKSALDRGDRNRNLF